MFRFRIHVRAGAGSIPWEDVLRPGRGILYGWLAGHDPELAAELHDDPGPARIGHSAPVFPDARPHRGRYAAKGDGWWEVGTTDRRVAAVWSAALRSRPVLSWGGMPLAVTAVEAVLPPPGLADGRVVWKTATPVCLRTKNGSRPLLPGEPLYQAALEGSLRNRATAAGVDPARVAVNIRWAGAKRTFAVTGTNGAIRTGCLLKVAVTAPPDLLRMLWTVGIGQATAGGFGWVADPEGARR